MKQLRTIGDRLSSLPDAILADILNLLPLETAVSTCVLSRQWLNLWPRLLTSIELNKNYGKDFFAVVNSVLFKLTSLELNRVNIVIPDTRDLPGHQEFCRRCFYYLGVWIPWIYTRSIKEFSLSVTPRQTRVIAANQLLPMCLIQLIQLPSCLLNCRSLVVLEIGNWFEYRLPDDDKSICLPNLKTLHINLFLLYNHQHEIFVRLLKSCPSLESLMLKEDGFVARTNLPKNDRQICLLISAPELKRLILVLRSRHLYDYVKIDAPKLEYIHMGDTSLARYKFVETPIGLANAKLKLCGTGNSGYYRRFDALNMLERISNVKQLVLTSYMLDILANLFDDSVSMPVLNNLADFRGLSLSSTCFKNLMRFLHICCPNLKTMSLELKQSEIENLYALNLQPAACLLTKVKIIRIENMGPSKGGLELLKHMLSNTRVLKLLHVDANRANNGPVTREPQLSKELEFCEELVKCFDKYIDCHIVFTGQWIKISSLAGEVQTLACGSLCCGASERSIELLHKSNLL